MRTSDSIAAIRLGGGLAALLGLLPLFLWLGLGLNGDVQYMFGGLAVAGRGFGGFVDTFIHRPLAYRFVMAAVSDVVGAFGIRTIDQVPFENGARIVTVLACIPLGLGLWRALRVRIGSAEAIAVAVATGLALVLAPSWDFLQAEWVGIYFAILAIVAALLPARTLVAGTLSGLCIVIAVAVKMATAPFALLALLLIAAIDRRRAIAAAAGGAAWGVVWLGSLVVMPVERHWLRDMATLNNNSPLRVGINWSNFGSWWRAVGGRIAMLPVIALVPAATVLVCRLVSSWRTRALIACGTVLAVVLAIAPLPAQGEGYTPHLAGLPVLSAGLVAFALVRWWRTSARPPVVPLAALLVLTAVGALVLTQSRAWRETNDLLVVNGLVVAAALLALWALAAGRGKTTPGRATTTAGAVLAAASVLAPVPALMPASAFSLDPATSPYTNASWGSTSRNLHVVLRGLSSELGATTPVLYLTYGAVGYNMGNPTDCRYPSPVWFKVAIRDPSVERFASYRENVTCLSSPIPRYLILQPGWLDVSKLSPSVRATIDRTYDCSVALHAGGLLACPRRP